MSKQIEVIEVGPRDGFQSVKCTPPIPTEIKLDVIDRLVAAGVKHIEYTSFVSPKAIPQLADAKAVTEVVLKKYPDLDLFALVPNLRGAQNAYELGLRKFVRLAWETALGCACGCVLLLPAGLSLLQNPRTIDPFSGYGYLFYGKSQQYGAIFYSTLLMPDAPYFKDLFQEGILKHTSLTAYLPLVGVAGGLAFCRARERHPFTYILKVCVACAFVPVLNSAFYALNSSYYARWYYMPILVLCGATCYLLSRPALAEQRLPRALRLTTFLTLTAVVFAVVPGKDDDGNTVFGVLDEPARFWAIFGMTMLGIVIFALLWHFCRRKRRWGAILTAAVLGFSLLYGSLHLSLTKYAQWDVESGKSHFAGFVRRF